MSRTTRDGAFRERLDDPEAGAIATPPTESGRQRVRLAAAVAALVPALLLHACGDARPPAEPLPAADPVPVLLRLSGAQPGDGTLLVKIKGAGIDSVSAPVDLEAFHAEVEEGVDRLLLVGAIRDGTLLTVWIPDRALLPRYAATVEQVAARVTYLQRPTDPYRVSLVEE